MRFRYRQLVVSLLAAIPLVFGPADASSAASEQISTKRAVELNSSRIVSLIQDSSNRLLDAHEIASLDYNVVTRPFQNNDTQRWLMTQQPGGAYTFRQVSSGRVLDAYESSGQDYRVVTRPSAPTHTQQWITRPMPNGSFLLQQVSSTRFLDAYESGEYQVVTRPQKTNNQQHWWIIDV